MTRHGFDHRSRPYLWNAPLVERNLRRRGADQLGQAKCPLCRKELVARVGKRGPYFHCGCRRKENPRMP